MRFLLFFCLSFLFFPSVGQFRLLTSVETGITFKNQLTENEKHNVLAYEYFYNGGGVAAGDFNNDGLIDLYFTGNMVSDRIYQNIGKMKFKDQTSTAGISKGNGWKTGVTLVDINQDGWLDIYVCYSGDGDEASRKNRLYINQKNFQFVEKASQYGLDLPTNSTQASFFDYDKDGDLDCFLLNHSIKDYKRFDATVLKSQRDPQAGDRLLRNDNGKYVDVSEQAHIKGNPLGFGLGIAIADINQDGWPDIYVSNDYIEQDYLYINQKNGTFSDQLETSVGHLSQFSMGNEVVDINNDGLPDILTLDMLPEDNRRQKLLYGPENYENYKSMVRNGFYHQIMRNMLQLNNGDGTFSEIGQLAGVSNTDWSWAPLVADFNNDGQKDIYITNGYLRDYTNMDFMKFYADKELKAAQGNPTAMMDIIKEMPSTLTKNYFFLNNGNLQFEDKTSSWACDQLRLSNGAIYVDLDNDGDLEIVTNNVNFEASIYLNEQSQGNYIAFDIDGLFDAQTYGTKVYVYQNGQRQLREHFPTRGFQSCMMMPLHFGVGKNKVDSVQIIFPNNQIQTLQKPSVNQVYKIKLQDSLPKWAINTKVPYFKLIETDTLPYGNVEDDYNDFKRQLLLPNMLSYIGPKTAQGDVNGDGLVDIYVGGSKGQSGAILLQQKNGSWIGTDQQSIDSDIMCTDTDAIFFDADKDGDLDLYVVSGGYSYLPDDLLLQDRLYLNDGKGNFKKAEDNLVTGDLNSDSCVMTIDFDKDGDLDLVIGGRITPGRYPLSPGSRLLQNDGKGFFTDVTKDLAPALETLGRITAGKNIDIDGDGWEDLVLVGEWQPILWIKNIQGKFLASETLLQNYPSNGWWSSLESADLDNDGDLDLIVGNYGKNNQLKPSPQTPVTIKYADFDQNEALDPFVNYYVQGKPYPLVSRDEALNQVFALRKKFPNYTSYADAGIEQLFTPEQLAKASTLEANQFESLVLMNQGKGVFYPKLLPIEAQISPIYAISLVDVDQDGLKDLIVGGNLFHTRIKIGKMDANYGQIFINRGNGIFEYIPQNSSGLQVKGEVRDIVVIPQTEGVQLHFFRNNDSVKSYRLNTKK
ncbi:VCBS repeat-containing protein [Flectobacillus sp. DC10W]|uniref:VCBS repeat-containing protein n=1 Tax=Flectobacillus longus TaxID=2984207 RepID=A0ABT6YKN4_9BACT|nr:VCBS repeat-containing protein [Flectobacillus longus]MDI9864149.1 VCBS repeat-containing protein [Flectobacillus longus]